jgi:hypothetical protein
MRSILFLIQIFRHHGISFVVTRALRYAQGVFALTWLRVFQDKTEEFEVAGIKYHPIYRLYNLTWTNERCVELSVVRHLISKMEKRNILEVGNVLSWYFPINHLVIDKYERGEGIINCDVTTYVPSLCFDLIVSISTIEHIGWDEPQRDGAKTLHAISYIQRMLAPGGIFLFTFPIGYNPILDYSVLNNKIEGASINYLKGTLLRRQGLSTRTWREWYPAVAEGSILQREDTIVAFVQLYSMSSKDGDA